MASEKIYKMKDYCQRIRACIEEYEEVNLAQYNNPRQELYEIIKNAKEDGIAYLSVAELIGEVIREFNSHGGAAVFPSWVGGKDEKFGKDYFEQTMKVVWPELFIQL